MKHVYFVSCPRVFHIEDYRWCSETFGGYPSVYDWSLARFVFADTPQSAIEEALKTVDYGLFDDEDGIEASDCCAMYFVGIQDADFDTAYTTDNWIGELVVDELGLVLDFGFKPQLPIIGYAEYNIPIIGRVPIDLVPDTPAKRALQALL